MSGAVMERSELLGLYDQLEAVTAQISEASHEVLTLSDLQNIATRRERVFRAQGAVDTVIVARMVDEFTPQLACGNSPRDLLMNTLRISRAEARRRLEEAEDLAPRRAVTGEPLAPKLPCTAAARSRGDIGTEHVGIIRKFMKKLPFWTSQLVRGHAEEILAGAAPLLTPEALRKVAERLLMTIDPDGEEPVERERARRRSFKLGRQDRLGMSEVTICLDPEGRALWEAVAAKLAAPGMCNPDDEKPCLDEEPDEATAERDQRTTAQRNHDAFKVLMRAMLASGQLGRHRGLPCTVVVRANLDQIESGEGWAVTGGGSWLPMADVIRLGSHSYHYLCIFDSHTEVPLYLGRTKRVASEGQRIAVLARDGGCTRPGCDAPPYWCEVHHRNQDWADGGLTDIDNLTLACGPDHRLLTGKGWRTQTGKDGRTEWIPPPILDSGQARVNDFHHPERFLSDPGVASRA